MEPLLWIALALALVSVVVVMAWPHGQATWNRGAAAPRIGRLIRRGRRIARTPIADLAEARVIRAVGTVRRLDGCVVAPVSRRPCVFWRVSVFVLRGSVRDARWELVLDRSAGTPFVLCDEDAECLIDPALSAVSMTPTARYQILRGQRVPGHTRGLFAEGGVTLEALRGEAVRIDETIVAIGDRVAVVGSGRRTTRSEELTHVHGQPPRATWIQIDGSEQDVLVSDDRRLLQG